MMQIPFFQYLSYSQRHPSVRLVCFFLIGTVLMFHPGPAALSIYKQNPRNAPLYSTLFPLDLLGFRTKTIFCNENSNFINFPYYLQLCHRLYLLLQISSVICLIRLLEHNLPGQIFSHIFLFKPRLYEKERLHTLRVPYTVFLYLPFDCFISAAPATAFPLFSDTFFPVLSVL